MMRASANSGPGLSVILCSHNPRMDYLARTVDALRQQTLPRAEWELLLVDNASAEPLAGRVELSWHPAARVLEEKQLGLTPARIRGIEAAAAPWLVMVDDDNVLAPDYLEVARDIGQSKPFLGAFGGGIEPEFEIPPPAWTRPHWGMIAIRPCTRSLWSNDVEYWETCPSGAGMCVRREVARRYVEVLQNDPLRRSLGRRGASLMSGEDVDLVFTGLAMGFGMGRFAELQLRHLIPPQRLEVDYLLKMYEAKGFTDYVVNALWKRQSVEAGHHGVQRLARLGWEALRREWAVRRFRDAARRGAARARQMLPEKPSSGS